MHYYGAVYRPPSEAYSLIVQCTLGCSHNKCAFCNMYKDKKFSIRPVEEVLRDLAEARSYERRIERIFLADGDALILPMDYLLQVLDFIREYFPECTRVAAYATTKAIERKTDEELRKLRGDVERRRKAMQELYLDKVSGLIDSAQFFEMNKSFLDEVSSAEARIEKLESELEQQKEESATIQTQMQRVRELAQVSHLTRELAVLLVDRVVVGPKDARTGEQKITIEWNF